MTRPPDITRLLHDLRQGRLEAEADLIRAVYPELRRIAAHCLRTERPDHTLQATALVHEAYLQLVGQFDKDWDSRAHFFAVAAQLMRRILVDHARNRKAQKRGGGNHRVELEDAMIISDDRLDEVIAIDAALEKLALLDPRQSKIVVLRFFGGLTEKEVATVLGVSPRTVKRDWNVARAWLSGELMQGGLA